MHGTEGAISRLADRVNFDSPSIRGDRQFGGPSAELKIWLEDCFPRLNAEVMSGKLPLVDLFSTFNTVLNGLDSPVRCSNDECRRRLVMVGLIGSSAERHSQEAGAAPGSALSQLSIGGWPFRKYVATLASRVGGPPRDSFLSFVMWNAPPVFVYLPDSHAPYLTLPSAFPEGGPLTFSDDPGERLFIVLLKRCAALEQAANTHLWPLCDGSLPLKGNQVQRHVEIATVLLKAVRAEMRLFLQRPEFKAPFFLDILRQYACAWEVDETYSAPSGAHDHAFIVRDKLLGTRITNYDEHIDQLFNVLDGEGQAELLRAISTRNLLESLEKELGIEPSGFAAKSPSDLADLAFKHPQLAMYYRLYQANGELNAAHWAMIYKYLVGPMQKRDYDAVVVSNYQGTTHMWMDTLREYMSARTNHPLSVLKDVFTPSRSGPDARIKVDVVEPPGA